MDENLSLSDKTIQLGKQARIFGGGKKLLN